MWDCARSTTAEREVMRKVCLYALDPAIAPPAGTSAEELDSKTIAVLIRFLHSIRRSTRPWLRAPLVPGSLIGRIDTRAFETLHAEVRERGFLPWKEGWVCMGLEFCVALQGHEASFSRKLVDILRRNPRSDFRLWRNTPKASA